MPLPKAFRQRHAALKPSSDGGVSGLYRWERKQNCGFLRRVRISQIGRGYGLVFCRTHQ